MTQYTELLHNKAENLPIDNDYCEENLVKVAALFRGFGEALTSFIEEYGYKGDLDDVSAKAQFLCERFKESNVKPPRDFKEWFMPNKKISRKAAFQICFAFNLSVDKTNDFFRRVQFERGFDCHTISEAVYYFCLRNGLSYTEAQEIIGCIPVPKKVKRMPDCNIHYTKTIIDNINSINDKEELIQYIKDNINDFQYNNATAIRYIQELWNEISKADGLAAQEGSIIWRQEQEVNDGDSHVVASSGASTWTVFSQILGLDNLNAKKYATGRSLTSVLSENKLMPLKAAYCFPNRQNIEKLSDGKLVGDNEIIRKMLIFLVFYTYWAKNIISKNDTLFYSAEPSDSERCLVMINNRLLDAGYPELYAGNPYDWLFIWAVNDDNPLSAFRYYMGEVFTVKEEYPED